MKYFSNEERFKYLISKAKNIENILTDNMLLISGDFYGIQKFIFDRLSTKNASKVLRAKSAFIQIFTEYISRYICSELGVEDNTILSMNAGKFEILIPKKDIDLETIQKKIDTYFIKNFYGLSGIMISSVECNRDNFKNETKYKALRKKIIDSVEDKKFQKFNLHKSSYEVLEYDTNIDNESLCKICNIRKIQEDNACKTCNSFKDLGKILSFNHIDRLIDSDKIGIDFDKEFIVKMKITQKITSYVLFKNDKNPADFQHLADNSCKDLETGIKSLAILKADVDNMGKFLEKSDITNNFENFNSFSESMDNFFSLYIPKMMKEKYPNTYTVFAGGDDLFLLGAWDEVLSLARDIESEFKAFVKSKELTISFGIAIAKPSTPISYLADYTEHLLEEAKEIDEQKDAISLFRETVKWKSYLIVFNKLEELFKDFDVISMGTLYRLLEICDMSKNINQDIRNTMWKSKLNYLFSRNIDKKYHSILNDLNSVIEKTPRETKMFLSEFIYKRRDA